MIAQEVESKRVDLQSLEDFLPEVSIEDQVVPGLGWESVGQQRQGDHEWAWNLQDSFGGAGRPQFQGGHSKDENDSLLNRRVSTSEGVPEMTPAAAIVAQDPKKGASDGGEEEELEEWEIEAEKHFNSEDVVVAPAPVKVIAKPKKSTEAPFNRHQVNAIMEQAAVQSIDFEIQEQVCSGLRADEVAASSRRDVMTNNRFISLE